MGIKITSKDKSMLLLIATVAMFAWFLFAYGFEMILSPSYENSDAAKIIKISKKNSLENYNLSRDLKDEDVKNRILLLFFMDHKCVKCIEDLDKLKEIDKKFTSKVSIIGVYNGNKDEDNREKLLKKLILRNDIDFAIIDDEGGKLTKEFDVKKFPTYILIDSRGVVDEMSEEVFSTNKVAKLIKKNRHNLNVGFLPISLERNGIVKNVLSFPSKIEYAKEIRYKLYRGNAFFVANSGSGNIMIFKENGKVIDQIGSKNSGYFDDNVKRSKFRSPMGMAFHKNKLYVADSLNNVIREIDFANDKVTTIIGNGKKGDVFASSEMDALDASLSYPTDVVFFPDRDHLIIANSGTNQLLRYNIKTKKIIAAVGNGDLGMKDGKYPNNSLAATSDMDVYGGKLYFVDKASGALRVLDSGYNVKTLIGQGVGKFGYKDGSKDEALMGEALGIFVNNNGVYVADSKNHVIRKYEYSNRKIKTIFGKDVGDGLGKREDTRFEEPEGLKIVDNKMFIVDSNNNRVVKIGFKDMKSSLIDILPKMKLPNEGFLEYLPNLERLASAQVMSDVKIPINISFDKGWKLNEYGPSFLNLLEVVGKKRAHLVSTYDWNMIKDNIASLPKLQMGKKYIIQGTIYYCQDKRNALCYISSYEQEINPAKKGKEVLNIEI